MSRLLIALVCFGGACAPASSSDTSAEPVNAANTCDPARANGVVPKYVRALLDTIATTEGTYQADANDGYDIEFTGVRFASCVDHPRTGHCGGGNCSKAAGRYQFLDTTWDGLGFSTFYPENQDRGAYKLVTQRVGNIPTDRALTYAEFVHDLGTCSGGFGLALEWASLYPYCYDKQGGPPLANLWNIYLSRVASLGGGTTDPTGTPGTLHALGKCGDIDHSQSANGTAAQIWECNGSGAQTFSLSGSGQILTSFGTCLDVDHSGTTDGTHVQEWTCNGTAAQTFSLTNMSLLSAVGKCIDVPSDDWTAGHATQLWDCNGTQAQHFTYDPGSGELRGANGMCLDVSGPIDQNGTPIIVWPCHGGSNQRWLPRGGAFHSALDTNRCLDVNGAGTANGTKIQLWDCNGTRAQQLALRGQIHTLGGKCLDVTSDNPSDGTHLQIWTCDGTDAQDWTWWLPK